MSGADSVLVVHGGVVVDGEIKAPDTQVAPVADVVMEDKPKAALPDGWPENAALQPDGSAVLTLDFPVRFKLRDADGNIRPGDSYEELHLCRLKGKHKQMLVTAAQKGAVDFEKTLIGASTGLDAGKIDRLYNEMDQDDIASAIFITNFFTGRGRKTGQPS